MQSHTNIYEKSEVDSLLGGKADNGHTHTLSAITDAGTAAGYNVPTSGNASAGQVVKGDDGRLSDARTPTAHTHTLSDVTDSGTAAALNVPASGNAAVGEVVKGDDTRLSDSRTPISHSHDEFVPIGGIIFYHSGITNASYPSGTFSKCDATGPINLIDKFVLPGSTSGGTGGSSTHTHTMSFSSANVTPCGGGGTTVAQVDITAASADHTPPYTKLIPLARVA